jgi:hypothetical protein
MSGPYEGLAPSRADGSFQAGPIGKATSILIWVAALSQVLLAILDWRDYATLRDDTKSWDPDSISAIDVILTVAALPAMVTFIIWLRQVRGNAERFCKAPHRHGRGWVIGGWFVPIISLWYPKQIVDDIVAASTPRTSPHADQLPRLRSSIVLVWWATWIASTLIGTTDPARPSGDPSAGDFLWTALISTGNAVLTVVCAVYAVRVIQLINNLQASRPWVAWWEPAASATSTS